MGELHLKKNVIYFDDIIIFSKTFDEHIRRLKNVFKQLEKHGFKLKASKCEFFSRIKCSIWAILSVIKESRQILTK